MGLIYTKSFPFNYLRNIIGGQKAGILGSILLKSGVIFVKSNNISEHMQRMQRTSSECGQFVNLPRKSIVLVL